MKKVHFLLIILFAATTSIHCQLNAEKYQQVLDNAHSYGLPAISALVQTNQEDNWKGTAGYTSLEQKTPLKVSQSFRLASISKVFTSIVVLQLVDENKLKLDDTISNYLPEDILETIPFSNEITILHLLSHSSGIYSFTENNKFWKEGYSNQGFSRTWSANELLKFLEGKKPKSEPVPPFSNKLYSNTNYILLGMIIETLTNNKLEYEYEQRIFSPLQMNNTFLEGFDSNHIKTIDSYCIPTTSFIKSAVKRKELTKVNDTEYVNLSSQYQLYNSWAWAAGGISSNTNDLNVFLTALKEGELVTDESQKVLMALNSSEDQGITYFGGSGGSDGIQATMLHLMPSNISVIILVNSTGNKKVNLSSIFKELYKIATDSKNLN